MEEGFVQPRSGYFSAAGTCELRLRPAWVAGAWEGPLADACEPHKLKPSQSIGVGLRAVALVEDADGEATEGERARLRAGGASGRCWEWEGLAARVARETGRERLGAAADRSRAGAVFSRW
jgi:hypothetical protein